MNRLKQVRLEQQKTQAEVAKAIGIRDTAISRYETGSREPKLETWKKLAAYFSTSVSYLQNLDGVICSTDYHKQLTALDRKHQRDLKSQEMYIGELPVEELMTWPKCRINPIDTWNELKWVMATDKVKDVPFPA